MSTKVELNDRNGVIVLELEGDTVPVEEFVAKYNEAHSRAKVIPLPGAATVVPLHRKVYVAGPMRGYPDFNFPAFDAAAGKLRAEGWDVVSPAEHDRSLGFDETAGAVDADFLVKAFAWDVEQILAADAIYLLPGWENSEGATLEHAVAKSTGKEILYDAGVTQQPAFNAAADTTLRRAQAISNQRGGEYLDSWSLDLMVTTFFDATLRRLGINNLTREEKRLLIVAALIDVKDSRMLGPWKQDTGDDGINYRAAYTTWRTEYEAGQTGNEGDVA